MTTVFVVVADCGLGGVVVIGAYAARPSDDEAQRLAYEVLRSPGSPEQWDRRYPRGWMPTGYSGWEIVETELRT